LAVGVQSIPCVDDLLGEGPASADEREHAEGWILRELEEDLNSGLATAAVPSRRPTLSE
jgi:hypothetical protein